MRQIPIIGLGNRRGCGQRRRSGSWQRIDKCSGIVDGALLWLLLLIAFVCGCINLVAHGS